MTTLTRADLDRILESLGHSLRTIRGYQHYPSYEVRCQRERDI